MIANSPSEILDPPIKRIRLGNRHRKEQHEWVVVLKGAACITTKRE